MKRLKNIFHLALEGILFGSLGSLSIFVSLYLYHYFTYEPCCKDIAIDVIPLYRLVAFPLIFILLSISFIFGKGLFKLLKMPNLQWFYNLVFFTVAGIGIDLWTVYRGIKEFSYEVSFESFRQLGDFETFALIVVLLFLYSFLFQIIKTRILFKPKTIC